MYTLFWYAIVGAMVFAASTLVLMYGYWTGNRFEDILRITLAGAIIGLLIGAILGFIDRSFRRVLKNRQNVVIYRPSPCSWCRGTGKKHFLIFSFKCETCSGRGSILVAEKSRACAWCAGSGKGFLPIFRCPVCGGSGWAHSGADEA